MRDRKGARGRGGEGGRQDSGVAARRGRCRLTLDCGVGLPYLYSSLILSYHFALRQVNRLPAYRKPSERSWDSLLIVCSSGPTYVYARLVRRALRRWSFTRRSALAPTKFSARVFVSPGSSFFVFFSSSKSLRSAENKNWDVEEEIDHLGGTRRFSGSPVHLRTPWSFWIRPARRVVK